MATYTLRQMLVRTLTNIGEPIAAANVPAVGAAITDPYQLQVCNFINHIKEEVEQEHQWSSRWQTYVMQYITGNVTQQIVDTGGYFLPTGAYPNSGSQVVRIHNPKFGREVALVFDITTFGIPFVLDELPLADITYYNTVLNQTPVAYSTNFTVQDLGNDNVFLNMYPGANSTRYIQITLYNPQGYVDPTNGTGNQTDVWDTGRSSNDTLTFGAAPALGATTGTLLTPFAGSTGTYTLIFSGPNTGGSGRVSQTITATLTQNSTAATAFSAALTSNLYAPNVLLQGITSGGLGCDSPLIVPSRLVELGAAWYALAERGESLGAGSAFSEDKYRRAMDDLATKDRAEQGDLMMVVA
jgi:hypothetical protein